MDRIQEVVASRVAQLVSGDAQRSVSQQHPDMGGPADDDCTILYTVTEVQDEHDETVSSPRDGPTSTSLPTSISMPAGDGKNVKDVQLHGQQPQQTNVLKNCVRSATVQLPLQVSDADAVNIPLHTCMTLMHGPELIVIVVLHPVTARRLCLTTLQTCDR